MGTINYTDTTATWSYTDTGSGSEAPGYNFAASITATLAPSTTSLMTMLALIGGALRIVARRKSCLPAGRFLTRFSLVEPVIQFVSKPGATR